MCKVRKGGVDRVHLSHDLSLKRFIFSPVHDLIITMLIRWSIIARVYRDYRSNRYKKKKGRKKKRNKEKEKKMLLLLLQYRNCYPSRDARNLIVAFLQPGRLLLVYL